MSKTTKTEFRIVPLFGGGWAAWSVECDIRVYGPHQTWLELRGGLFRRVRHEKAVKGRSPGEALHRLKRQLAQR